MRFFYALIVLVALAAIYHLEYTALQCGIDGARLSITIGALAGIAGAVITKVISKRIKKGK